MFLISGTVSKTEDREGLGTRLVRAASLASLVLRLVSSFCARESLVRSYSSSSLAILASLESNLFFR